MKNTKQIPYSELVAIIGSGSNSPTSPMMPDPAGFVVIKKRGFGRTISNAQLLAMLQDAKIK